MPLTGGNPNTNLRQQLRMSLFNARSLANKLPELHYLLYDSDIDCFCITETWLSDHFADALLDPKQCYNIIRCDRTSGRNGGGVIALVKRKFSVISIDLNRSHPGTELACFDLTDCLTPIRVVVVYRPPSSCFHSDVITPLAAMTDLIACLDTAINKHGPTVILGDFNCPEIDWQSMRCSSELCHRLLYNFTVYNGFSQCVTQPTRQANILDIVLTNDTLLMSRIEVAPPFSTSDHCVVDIDLLFSDGRCAEQVSNSAKRKIYLWKNGDYKGMKMFLSCYKWDDVFMYNFTVDDLWHAFREVIDYAVSVYVPCKYVNCNNSYTKPLHKYPRNIRDLITRKRCIWRQHRRFPTDKALADKYVSINNECRAAIRDFEVQQERSVIESGNSGRFLITLTVS
jgi:hypothetical protein